MRQNKTGPARQWTQVKAKRERETGIGQEGHTRGDKRSREGGQKGEEVPAQKKPVRGGTKREGGGGRGAAKTAGKWGSARRGRKGHGKQRRRGVKEINSTVVDEERQQKEVRMTGAIKAQGGACVGARGEGGRKRLPMREPGAPQSTGPEEKGYGRARRAQSLAIGRSEDPAEGRRETRHVVKQKVKRAVGEAPKEGPDQIPSSARHDRDSLFRRG